MDENDIKIENVEPLSPERQHSEQPTRKTIIYNDIEFFKRNNIELHVEIEEAKIQPCMVLMNQCLDEYQRDGRNGYRKTFHTNLHSNTSHSHLNKRICGVPKLLVTNEETHTAYRSKMKGYECYYCKRTESRFSTLKAHMRLHSGKNQFACDKLFKCEGYQKSTLHSYKKLHSSNFLYLRQNSSANIWNFFFEKFGKSLGILEYHESCNDNF